VNRARAALLLLAAPMLSGLVVRQSEATPIAQARQALVFVIGGVSVDEVLSAPPLHQLATSGGVALMTSEIPAATPGAYAAVGNGGARPPMVAGPTVLANALAKAGLQYCEGGLLGAPLYAGEPTILSDPATPYCAGLTDPALRFLEVGDSRAVPQIGDGRPLIRQGIARVAEILREQVLALPNRQTLILVVTPTRSGTMDEIGDEVTPILMAEGMPEQLFPSSGSMMALTSDSTRVDGLVSNVDVAPTILQFFGIPLPSEMEGHPIRVVDASPPLALHRLHLEQRRIRIPLQVGEAVFVTLVGLAMFGALIALGRGKRLSPAVLAALRFLLLCAVALYLVDLVGGLLPRMTYVVVVPFVVLGTLALAWAARAARWPGPIGPFVFLGALALAFVVVDAVFFGGRAFRVPLTGGTMFDGTRFYGLPNVFIALLLAGSIFVAVSLEPFAGFALIFAVGLFAGFPRLGANVGASITLFAGAGLWFVLRTRPRICVKEVALVGGVMLVGLAMVLLANRYLPGSPTHATRFVERSTSSLSTAVSTFRDRLSTAFHLLNAQPEGYVPMLALFVVLWLAIARPEPIRSGFALAGEPWRWALVAIVLASLVGFVVNDTGTTAAAPGLIFAATGLAYPVFAREASKRE
jgi:hypothetical protein